MSDIQTVSTIPIVGEKVVFPKTPTLTPTVIKPTVMDFYDAMREVVKGKRITRLEWNNTDYCLLKNGWLTIWRGKFFNWNVNDGDMLATDWMVVDESN